jgi:hypothetical protein
MLISHINDIINIGGYISLTYSMVSEVIKLFHHNLFEDIQVCNQNDRLLTDIKPALHNITNDNNYC